MANKKIEELSPFEWAMLVGSWRYYEYRSTAASACFPADILSHFWASGNYNKDVLDRIAYQFAKVDHERNGEKDWETFPMCDRVPWAHLYAFCNAWCDGFKEIYYNSRNREVKIIKAFYCATTNKWHPASLEGVSLYSYLDPKRMKGNCEVIR